VNARLVGQTGDRRLAATGVRRYAFSVNHFTDDAGYKAIGSQVVWTFRVSDPPGGHPRGAYFTTLPADTPNLANRLRIPRTKLAFIFEFSDGEELEPLDGDRGRFIFYSRTDYAVEKPRQLHKGETGL
jgi:hypothetical protein